MEFLVFVGAVTMSIIILFIIGEAVKSVKDIIDDLIYEYRYKHRFDKPPTAKCYCVDCKHYDNKTYRCYGFHEDSNRLVGDAMFCYRAEPRERKDKGDLYLWQD